ncbi:protein 33K [Falcon aviadenovirus A]|nr:protein 33K [Falcon aviadenovirus A]
MDLALLKVYQPLEPIPPDELYRRQRLLNLYGFKTGAMAQKMLEKVSRPKDVPYDGYLTPDEEDIDGETIGSQDTETEEEEDKEELTESQKEIEDELNHPVVAEPQRKRRMRRSPPPIPPKRQSREHKDPPTKRGNYSSWTRYRVDIYQALYEAVFDRRKAAELLKRRFRIFVPSSVLAYHARKLSSSFSSSSAPHDTN